jgi:hypothetical protein
MIMERRTIIFGALSFLILCSIGINVNAQEISGKFLLSTSEYYSPKTGTNTTEIGVGYIFGHVGVKINYERVGLAEDRDVNGGTVSILVPAYYVRTFSIIPEVSAGILQGNVISKDESCVKSQLQAGVNINYTLSRTMSCGVTCKSLFYSEGVIPLIGWSYSIHF